MNKTAEPVKDTNKLGVPPLKNNLSAPSPRWEDKKVDFGFNLYSS
jgi:hypothetical protein